MSCLQLSLLWLLPQYPDPIPVCLPLALKTSFFPKEQTWEATVSGSTPRAFSQSVKEDMQHVIITSLHCTQGHICFTDMKTGLLRVKYN